MVSATTPAGETTYLYNGDGLEAAATPPATSGSVRWNPPTDVDSTRAIDAETCTSATFCVAGTSWSTPVDADNGTSWSTPSDIDSTRSVDAVTCTATTFCEAVGASGYAATYNGTTWASATDVDSTRTMDAVSCTSSTFCEAVDTAGYAAKYTGTWATATDIDSSRSIDTITCQSSTFCIAAGASGYAAKYTGTWATATDIDSSRTVKAVLCPSSTLCVAVDSSGYATTYNGSTWATATDIDGANTLEALTCVSTTDCMASNAVGNALTYNGTTWSSATDVDATRSVTSISCPTTTFCVTGDGSGYAAVYAPVTSPTAVSQLTWNSTSSLALILSDGAADYIYGPNTTPVEEVNLATSTPTFMTYTPADSTWFTTNASGDETSFYGYDAFGTLAFGTPASAFGYAGQYLDATTGFSNMRARWYSTQGGEFTTVDLDLASTDAPYVYTDDDPINGIDPSGQFWGEGSPVDIGDGFVDVGTGIVDTIAAAPIAIAVVIGGAVGVAWSVATPTRAGGTSEIPIWFGQKRINPTFTGGASIAGPASGNPIRVFPWQVGGKPVAVAADNQTLANYAINNVTHPKVVWIVPTPAEKLRLDEPALIGGSLPAPQTLVTANRNCTIPVDVPGSVNGVITSVSFIKLEE
jgi:RHS repeat-associated protein